MRTAFIVLSCFLSVACLWAAWMMLCSVRRPGLSRSHYARRPVWFGMVLGTLCLVWSAYHGCGMLEGDLAKFHAAVWCLVPVTSVLSFFYLDYLNARSAGGFLVLSANHLINAAFVYDVPCRGVYGIVCLILGVLGLVGIGLPWRYRDILELAERRAVAGRVLSGAFALAALALGVMPFFARL